MKVLVTGAAGFIGSNVAQKLVLQGAEVVGIDNVNDYYDVNIKYERLKRLSNNDKFTFVKGNIADKTFVDEIFKKYKFDIVINLAAQAGVRYSLENPDAYIESNMTGFYNILEACRKFPVDHLIYASSSSVYGANEKVPFEEEDRVDNPVSLYAATKKSNELMAYTYSHLFGIPMSGLRFFTVYGPLGRPDMAYFSFTDKFFKEEPIKIFNNMDFENDLYRDFTYIDDIVEGVTRLIDNPPTERNRARHEVYNIGNNSPVKLMDFIFTLEEALSNSLNRKVEFIKVYEPIKPGDVQATFASTEKLERKVGFKPKTDLLSGLQEFTDWYVEYYGKERGIKQ